MRKVKILLLYFRSELQGGYFSSFILILTLFINIEVDSAKCNLILILEGLRVNKIGTTYI